jgi:UDPglucose 6-dehydrogenase
MDGYTVVVTKSTVPVGTGDEVEKIIKEINPNADFDVVSNPEFLREGNAIGDFINPDRVVIGTDSKRAKAVMAGLYKKLEDNGAPIVYTTRRSSELIKYAANAFLAVKITYINEIANLCEKVGAKVDDVAKGIGMDSRIGPKFLQAGPGYGGSCFPKDTLALSKTAKDYDAPINIVETTIKVNEERKYVMLDKIINACDGEVRGKNIGILGLAFKQNTDDMRDAISLTIIPELEKRGANIKSYDPQAMEEAKHLLGDKTEYVNNPYSAVDNADMAVILTEWDEFRNLEIEKLRKSMNGNIVVDLRNLLDINEISEAGLKYHSVGRAKT